MSDEFTERFHSVFEEGVADIKHFVRPGVDITVEVLRAEALGLQQAVDKGDVKEVSSVDEDLVQIDFASDW